MIDLCPNQSPLVDTVFSFTMEAFGFKDHSWHLQNPCMQLESMIELMYHPFHGKLTCRRTFSSLVHLFTNLRLDSRDSIQEVPNPGSWNPINTHRPLRTHTNVPMFWINANKMLEARNEWIILPLLTLEGTVRDQDEISMLLPTL
jgi:hypothetical protein